VASQRENTVIQRDLVYDVGANDGADTSYYLSRGFRVLAIEAHPELAARLETRFAEAIRRGRCTILHVGVASEVGEATFYLSEAPVLSSFDRKRATKDGQSASEVRVACQTFDAILAEHGIPQLLKVDIEGLDYLCILALDERRRPPFVSFEADERAAELVRHLDRIGYRGFRLVDQNTFAPPPLPPIGSGGHIVWSARQWARAALRRRPVFHAALKQIRRSRPSAPLASVSGAAIGDSGPMPQESSEWLSLADFLHHWVCVRDAGLLDSSWFDVHATLKPASAYGDLRREDY